MIRARTITAAHSTEPERASATGRWREVREGGERVLVVELEVTVGGRYGLYADLCDEGDDEVGYVRREVELDAGVVEVALPMQLYVECETCAPCGLRIVRR